MDTAIKKLTSKLPPPTAVRGANVDWDKLEAAIGIRYPQSYKDFIAVYGQSIWFDDASPFITDGRTDKDIKKFRKTLDSWLVDVKKNICDASWNKLDRPVYPEKDGLYPFMTDTTGYLFCWQTSAADPNEWPCVCWRRGPLVELGHTTIGALLLGYLERKPPMTDIWGDIKELDQSRMTVV